MCVHLRDCVRERVACGLPAVGAVSAVEPHVSAERVTVRSSLLLTFVGAPHKPPDSSAGYDSSGPPSFLYILVQDQLKRRTQGSTTSPIRRRASSLKRVTA